MLKIQGVWGVDPRAVELINQNGGKCSFDGLNGEFEKLPADCQMGEMYGFDAGPSGTCVSRDMSFNGHIVKMTVEDTREFIRDGDGDVIGANPVQYCRSLKIKKIAPDLSQMEAVLGK